MNKTESLEGEVSRIIYSNEENGYCIFELKEKNKTSIVSGIAPNIIKHGNVKVLGEWVTNKYGTQLKAKEIEALPPESLEAIIKYLGSGLVKGIGESLASRIVSKFKNNTFYVLDNSINDLLQVEGIGKKKLEGIKESWKKQKGIKDVMMFLTKNGVGTARSAKIYKLYGDDSINVISTNPYKLADDMIGVGFKSADTIAKNVGILPDSAYRIEAGINYVMDEMKAAGHCAVPHEILLSKSYDLLEVEADQIQKVISEQISLGNFVYINDLVYTKRTYEVETRVGDTLVYLTSGKPLLKGINIFKEIERVEKEVKIQLSEKQKEAIEQVSKSKVTVITGGPGVGKTTLVNSILNILKSNEFTCLLCAPTGRAAKRITETSGQEAKTIHRLLEYDKITKRFKRNTSNPLECDFIVIDESSMVDIFLMDSLLQAVPAKANLIIVGDVDQLPSVGAGQVLKDIIESKKVSVVKLTEIFRQAKESRIITNSYRINNGLLPINSPEDTTSDFYFINQDDPEKIQSLVVQLVSERIPNKFGFDPLKDIQVLVPMNKAALGTQTLNSELQKALNPKYKTGINRSGNVFAVGDKVMQLKNNYDKEVFNGDIGFIEDINSEEQEVYVLYEDRIVVYEYDELDQIKLAYAATIHKCISESTCVYRSGISKIKNIEVGDSLLDSHGNAQRVKDKIKTQKKAYRLKTKEGYEIVSSKEHRFLVNDGEKEIFKKVEDINKDIDRICISRETPEEIKEYELIPIFDDFKDEKHQLLNITSLDEDLAYFTGYLVGNGSYGKLFEKDARIELTIPYKSTADWIESFFNKIGLRYTITAKNQKKDSSKELIRIYSHSVHFRKILAWMGLSKSIGKNKTVPEKIFNTRNNVIRNSFICGLFDADASMRGNMIRFVSSSIKVIQSIQLMLLLAGVISYYTYEEKTEGYYLHILSSSNLSFLNNIGSKIKEKEQKISELIKKSVLGKSDVDIIPDANSIFKQLRFDYYKTNTVSYCQGIPNSRNLSNLINGKRKSITYSMLKKVFNVFESKLGFESLKVLTTRIGNNYYYARIESITEEEEEEMVDIEIDSKEHEFWANGFVSHNSQGSEYKAIVLVVHTQHYPLLQKNLIYTGITRGKNLVVLIGSTKALNIALMRSSGFTRYTQLKKWMEKSFVC